MNTSKKTIKWSDTELEIVVTKAPIVSIVPMKSKAAL
jgi:hypothetical protein